MAKPAFFLTQLQVEVLRIAAEASEKHLPTQLHRAFYSLRRQGMVDGSIWGNEGTRLTPIGRKAIALLDAIAKRST